MKILALLTALPLLASATLAVPAVVPPAAVAAQDIELPLVYRGDGMTVVITAVNDRTAVITGTLRLAETDAMPFTLTIEVDRFGNEKGRGKVTTPGGKRTIRSKDIDDETVQVTYRAKRYKLTLATDSEAKDSEAKERPKTEREPVASAPARKAAVGGPITLSLHTLTDPGMGGMKSHTVLVPEGWKVEGGGFWMPTRYYAVLPSQDITVTSPEGLSVQIEPTMLAKELQPPPYLGIQPPAKGTADKGFPVLPFPKDLDEWKRWLQTEVIQLGVPGATRPRVLDAAVIPELTWQLARNYAPYKAMLEQSGAESGMRITADCVVLGFESTYRLGGKDHEELRLLALTYSVMESEFTGRNTIWTIERAVTFRAPKGQLEANMSILKAIADSVQMTPEWFRMRADHEAKLMKISRDAAARNMREAQKRMDIVAQSGKDLNDIIMSGYRKREAIKSSSYDKVIHSIRGTEEYVTPGSSTAVHLPSGYDHVYSNDRGEYLLTNDALFGPIVEAATNDSNWTRMTIGQ